MKPAQKPVGIHTVSFDISEAANKLLKKSTCLVKSLGNDPRTVTIRCEELTALLAEINEHAGDKQNGQTKTSNESLG